MANIYPRWRLIIAFLIAAIAIFIDAENVTVEMATTELPTQNGYSVDIDDLIFGNESCLPAQIEHVNNCWKDFDDEINNFNNESTIIFDKIHFIFKRNPLIIGPTKLLEDFFASTTNSTSESTAPPEEPGSSVENATTIIEYLQREPNMTRQVLDQMCTATENSIKCVDAGIKNTDCNPGPNRFDKVFQNEFCNTTLLDIFLDSSACVFKAALEPRIASCADRLNNTISDNVYDIIQRRSSVGEAMCKITNLVYGCFSSSVESCSLELLNQSADIGGKFNTAMFDYKCEVKKSMEGDVEVVEG